MCFRSFGLYVIKAKVISIMHILKTHKSFVNVQLIGIVWIDFLGRWGVKVVNMDLS